MALDSDMLRAKDFDAIQSKPIHTEHEANVHLSESKKLILTKKIITKAFARSVTEFFADGTIATTR